MGKLFKLIESDIIDLAFDDKDRRDYEFSNYVKVSLSESRITKLYQMLEQYYKDNNIKKQLSKFPFDTIRDYRNEVDREKIEKALDFIEENINDDINTIINEVSKINKSNLIVDDKIYVEVLKNENINNQFDGLVSTLKEAIVHNYSQNNKLVSINDLVKSFKTQASNIISLGLRRNVIDVGSKEYKKMKEYVDNPAKAFAKYNPDAFDNSYRMHKFEKYAELDKIEAIAAENEDEFLDKIDADDIDSSEDLGSDIVESIRNYINTRHIYLKEHDENEFPTLGKFLYDLKDKITEILPDLNVSLLDDKDSIFVKNFLYNPIDAMSKYIDEKIKNHDENDLLKDKLFDDEEADNSLNKLIENQKKFKEIILGEKNNYNEYSKDKIDVWAQRQKTNANRFENMFKSKMNNTNIPDVLKNNKGGFFENFFGTTSKEYKEFSKELLNMVEDGPEKGNLFGLKDKADAYLMHKFKKENDLFIENIKEEDIRKLDSTSQGRVRLCLAVLESIDYAAKAEYRDLNPFNENLGKDIFENVTKLNKEFDDKFHNDLKNDSEIENNNKTIDNDLNNDNNIIENDFKK